MDFSIIYQVGDYFYLVLLVYLVAYVVFFGIPLLGYLWGGAFDSDIERLADLIEKAEREGVPSVGASENSDEAGAEEVDKEKEELVEELTETHQELEEARQKRDELEGQGEYSEAEALEERVIPGLEEHCEELNRKIDALDQDSDSDTGSTDPDEATARLENLHLLTADYRHPFVKDAVSYLRAKFPRAEYQHFELEPLPSVSKYLEQVSMARNMAGAFVLLGLLGTMMKLDGVVEQIASLAHTSQMEPQRFLGQMGTLMQGVEGAFFNSILGVLLGVLALVAVGLLNRRVQRRLDRLDHTMSQKVLPGLVNVHNQLMPERTLADLLRGAGDRIDQLDSTVEKMRDRMANTIGSLSGELENMLERFEHYEEHYDLINKQVKALDERGEHLEEQSEQLRDQTERLAEAGDELADPISEMNETLQKHLQKVSQLQEDEYLQGVLEDIKEALEAERKARKEQLKDVLENNRLDQEELLQTVRTALGEEGEERQQHVEDLLKQNTELRENIQEQQAAIQEALDAQNEELSSRLGETADALQASSPQQLRGMLEELNEASDRLHKSSETLSDTAKELSDRMEHSSDAMTRASQSLDRVARAPTFFAWLTRRAWPWVMSRTYSLFGKQEKANRMKRRIARSGHPPGGNGQADSVSSASTDNKPGVS